MYHKHTIVYNIQYNIDCYVIFIKYKSLEAYIPDFVYTIYNVI